MGTRIHRGNGDNDTLLVANVERPIFKINENEQNENGKESNDKELSVREVTSSKAI